MRRYRSTSFLESTTTRANDVQLLDVNRVIAMSGKSTPTDMNSIRAAYDLILVSLHETFKFDRNTALIINGDTYKKDKDPFWEIALHLQAVHGVKILVRQNAMHVSWKDLNIILVGANFPKANAGYINVGSLFSLDQRDKPYKADLKDRTFKIIVEDKWFISLHWETQSSHFPQSNRIAQHGTEQSNRPIESTNINNMEVIVQIGDNGNMITPTYTTLRQDEELFATPEQLQKLNATFITPTGLKNLRAVQEDHTSSMNHVTMNGETYASYMSFAAEETHRSAKRPRRAD